jgi:hypothetical protein
MGGRTETLIVAASEPRLAGDGTRGRREEEKRRMGERPSVWLSDLSGQSLEVLGQLIFLF